MARLVFGDTFLDSKMSAFAGVGFDKTYLGRKLVRMHVNYTTIYT